jgi:hypothetical protein
MKGIETIYSPNDDSIQKFGFEIGEVGRSERSSLAGGTTVELQLAD